MQKSLQTPFLVTTKIPSFKRFITISIILGAVLSGLLMHYDSHFMKAGEENYLYHYLELAFLPAWALGFFIFEFQPLNDFLRSMYPPPDFGFLWAFVFMVPFAALGGALFFGIFGALIWYGLYRKKIMLAVALCLLVLTYALPVIFMN